jgi:hypothetical protein
MRDYWSTQLSGMQSRQFIAGQGIMALQTKQAVKQAIRPAQHEAPRQPAKNEIMAVLHSINLHLMPNTALRAKVRP